MKEDGEYVDRERQEPLLSPLFEEGLPIQAIRQETQHQVEIEKLSRPAPATLHITADRHQQEHQRVFVRERLEGLVSNDERLPGLPEPVVIDPIEQSPAENPVHVDGILSASNRDAVACLSRAASDVPEPFDHRAAVLGVGPNVVAESPENPEPVFQAIGMHQYVHIPLWAKAGVAVQPLAEVEALQEEEVDPRLRQGAAELRALSQQGVHAALLDRTFLGEARSHDGGEEFGRLRVVECLGQPRSHSMTLREGEERHGVEVRAILERGAESVFAIGERPDQTDVTDVAQR